MLANGIAQSLAIAGIWIKVARTFSVRVPLKDAAAVLAAGLAMWLVVWRVNQLPASPAVQLVLAIPLGALAYLLALRILKVLDEADGSRLGQVVKRLPGVAGRVAVECVAGMVRGRGAQV